MLPRIFTGTVLSIGCILTVQAAEVAFDRAIEELDAAFAAPAELAPDALRAASDCVVPDQLPCDDGMLMAVELPPDVGEILDCLASDGGTV